MMMIVMIMIKKEKKKMQVWQSVIIYDLVDRRFGNLDVDPTNCALSCFLILILLREKKKEVVEAAECCCQR